MQYLFHIDVGEKMFHYVATKRNDHGYGDMFSAEFTVAGSLTNTTFGSLPNTTT